MDVLESCTAPVLRYVEEITQDWSLIDIVTKRPPPGWRDVFAYAMPEFQDLEEDLEAKGPYFPLKKDLFKAFEYTPLDQVKVVIVGQDPYHQMVNIRGHNVPRAQGMSFSVDRGDAIPESLKNIYKELSNTIPGFVMPHHGDLSYWACQGVLLLNQSLTVAPGKAGSHGKIWSGFIAKVLGAINEKRPGTVFILWGKQAQSMAPELGEKAIILEGAHPSPFSAYKGFFGGDYFNKTNQKLIAQGKTPIDWQIPNY